MNDNAQILIVDDDPWLSQAAARLFRTSGYAVSTAATGGNGHRPGDLQEDRRASRRAHLGGVGSGDGECVLFHAHGGDTVTVTVGVGVTSGPQSRSS
jgi:hypothetical protein